MFAKTDINGNPVGKDPNRKVLDCSKDKILVEQSHKDEVDINKIIRRHGVDMIQKTALLRSSDYTFDDVTGNDFTEALHKIMKAKASFESLPSAVRKEFDNNPARFLDFIQNPDNAGRLVEMGLAAPPPDSGPVKVMIVNPSETIPPGEKGDIGVEQPTGKT